MKVCFADRDKLAQDEYCLQNGIVSSNDFYLNEYDNKFSLLNDVFKKENRNCRIIADFLKGSYEI